jgi:hypothetical protein
MKKFLVPIACFLGLIAFLFFIPHFLKLDKIQDQITIKANEISGMEISLGEVSLHWLPYPHLYIGEIRAQNDAMSIDVPELRAIPDWRALMHRHLALGRIKIIEPAVHINTKTTNNAQGVIKPAVIVDVNFDVDIENGSLTFAKWALNDSITVEKNSISDININAAIQNRRIKYDFFGKSTFCGEINSSGRFDLNNSYYRIDFFYTKFNLFRLTKSIGEQICPVDQQNNFSAHLEGITSKNFKLRLKGNIPTLQLTDDAPILTPPNKRLSDITIEKYDDDFFVHLDAFRLNYPQMDLNGAISRRTRKETGIPIWNIDISGKDLDLDQARTNILALWGENETAQTVCSIVRGGTAGSARYVFNGPADDFKHIKTMKIWADLSDVPILIPGIDLFLDKATGPISILDGILSGDGLTANISNSSGTNGSLLLGLNKGARTFRLDLDLDIDVSKLQDVLVKIVEEPGFRDEITHFNGLKGRAKGHLTIGDDFDNLKTIVDVKEIKADGNYDRIPWPFSIQSGTLRIAPGKTEWTSIAAHIGPHTIFKNSAQVSWEKQATIDIKDFEADIDGTSLFTDATLMIDDERYTARQFFSPILTELKGAIHLADGHLSGPATAPSQWKYGAHLTADDITLRSQHLPGEIFLRQIAGTVSNTAISFSSQAQLLNDSFELSADYHHKDLAYWQGTSLFSGTINQKMIDWLDNKKVIPSSFQFKTPLSAEDIRLTTEGNNLKQYKLTGKIIADKGQANPAVLELDINHLRNQFQNSISLTNNKETGKLVYNVWNSTPMKTLLTWKGELSSTTFDCFFMRHPFTSGKLNGVFSMLSSNQPKDSSYTGYIEAKNLQWETDKGITPFIIDTLLMNGNKDNIRISDSQISFPEGDSASINGSIVTDTKNFDINLQLASKKLTSESLANTYSYLQKDTSGEQTASKQQSEISIQEASNFLQNLSGRLGFSVDNFIYTASKSSTPADDNTTGKTPEGKEISPDSAADQAKGRPWTNVTGEAAFGDGAIQVDFASAQLCGMEFTGKWTSDGVSTDGHYFINDTGQLSFQDTLPCLGINQSVIEGDFTLSTELSGTPENWRQGKLSLTSPNGIIRRMELLSKIFSVVNFTEFLTFKDLPDINTEGLQYNQLVLDSHIDQNKLVIDKAFLKGKGLNLTGQGTMDLKDLTTNFTVFVAPFKMLDAVVTNIPLVGRIIGGKKGAILTFPVKVEGPLGNPSVSPLDPSSIGKATIDFITDTLSLPFAIFTPFLEKDKQTPEEK